MTEARPVGPGGWTPEHHRGSAATFHARPLPDPAARAVWWFEVAKPALILGSTQSLDRVDPAAVRRAGMDEVRRRSGGGAVLLLPGAVTWIDVVIPAADPHWESDVGRSFHWLGAVWASVLRDLGLPEVTVHTGPLVRSRWSDLVCFAGLGSGEVLVEGKKAVGISQRRTRGAARFQCAVVHHWDPAPLVDVLNLTASQKWEARSALADVAVGIGPVRPRQLVVRLLDALAAAPT